MNNERVLTGLKITTVNDKSEFEPVYSEPVKQEHKCNPHPDAPHGFARNASLNAGRYVCECEGWEPDQAEQEPVACKRCEELAADKGTWYRMAERFAIRNEELKKALAQALNLIEGEWPEGDEIAQPVIDTMKATLANQPAPVRTKDLTDDELNKLLDYWSEDERSAYGGAWSADGEYVDMKSFARAAIAADREKNK